VGSGNGVKLRELAVGDLVRANAVIEAAVMTWDLPDRVKRLSLPSYRYDAHELSHLTLLGAEDDGGDILGVAAWEPADSAEVPDDSTGLLLHGLYVVPALHRRGIGSQLLDAAVHAARDGGFHGLLVKANPDARSFFAAKGMRTLPVGDARRDYPYRVWMDV